jgi:hypothetical protein
MHEYMPKLMDVYVYMLIYMPLKYVQREKPKYIPMNSDAYVHICLHIYIRIHIDNANTETHKIYLYIQYIQSLCLDSFGFVAIECLS